MGLSRLHRWVSFQTKVLVPVVTVMFLLMAGTMWLVNRRITAQLEAQAAQNLETADGVFNMNQANRVNALLSRFASVRSDSRYSSIIHAGDAKEAAGFFDACLQHELALGDPVAIVTCDFSRKIDNELVSARSDPAINAGEFQVRSSLAVSRAFAGETVVDTIRVGTRLFYVVSVPVNGMYDDEIGGVVTFGIPIGAETAKEIKQFARSEILLVADGQVAATSMADTDISPELMARFNELSVEGFAQRSNQTRKIPLGERHFVGRAGRFDSLSGDSRLGYILLSSYDEPLAVLRATQEMLLAVGLLGIAFSTAIVGLLISRVTRPLRELRDSAEAVGHGDFSKHVEVASRDEFGELATVFNQMRENIKTSRQELEKTVETLKTTQGQLIQSEKLSGIGEFVAGVAHELNNPLTSVMGFAELLTQSDMPEQQRRYLDVISKSAKRCQKIVSSLLSFARRHAPERKVLCVNGIVESAVEILAYQMRTNNIEVITHLDPNLPATELDSHQMQQVFLNIINNARQAMEAHEPGGWLRITTESSDERVRVIFQDNGPGIPAENLKKIFNPFFTTKEVGKGTGLGLSLCYGIVSEHGGTITPSSNEGEGATFIIELPVTRSAVTEAQKKGTVPLPAAPREGIGKRVLVIDDEDSILQMISEALLRNGYRVDVARDGETALRRLGQYHYDLALCDWKMPGLNGQQIYERLHEANPEMSKRLIFITGDVVNEKTQEFLREEGKLCLSKPFTLREFRTAINRVMTTTAK